MFEELAEEPVAIKTYCLPELGKDPRSLEPLHYYISSSISGLYISIINKCVGDFFSGMLQLVML